MLTDFCKKEQKYLSCLSKSNEVNKKKYDTQTRVLLSLIASIQRLIYILMSWHTYIIRKKPEGNLHNDQIQPMAII